MEEYFFRAARMLMQSDRLPLKSTKCHKNTTRPLKWCIQPMRSQTRNRLEVQPEQLVKAIGFLK
ncbi:hypothetical protein [Phormidium nigroviride]